MFTFSGVMFCADLQSENRMLVFKPFYQFACKFGFSIIFTSSPDHYHVLHVQHTLA